MDYLPRKLEKVPLCYIHHNTPRKETQCPLCDAGIPTKEIKMNGSWFAGSYIIVEDQEISLIIEVEYFPPMKGTVRDGRQIEPDEPEGYELKEIYMHTGHKLRKDLKRAEWVWFLINRDPNIERLLLQRAGLKEEE